MTTAVRRDESKRDVLADILSVTRVGSAVVAHAELVPPWGLTIDPIAEAHVHVVLRGRCWVRTTTQREPIELLTGDVVLLRGGVGHSICDSLETQPRPHVEALADMPRRLAALPRSRASETTLVMCAKYLFESAGTHPLLSLVPELVHVPAARQPEQLQLLLRLLHAETLGRGDGSELVIPRLVDSLLVVVVRAWIDTHPPNASGWFGALRDPAVARALSMIHAHPEAPWSVERLARSVGQSRAAFARRFTELVGEPPLAYVTLWRMSVAAKLLAETAFSLDEVASRVGYATTAAFSKAFRRSHGLAPGAFRNAR